MQTHAARGLHVLASPRVLSVSTAFALKCSITVRVAQVGHSITLVFSTSSFLCSFCAVVVVAGSLFVSASDAVASHGTGFARWLGVAKSHTSFAREDPSALASKLHKARV